MPQDRRDAVTVRYDGDRLRFEPRSDGRWRLFEETWTGCHWRTRGAQLVNHLAVTADDLQLPDEE